ERRLALAAPVERHAARLRVADDGPAGTSPAGPARAGLPGPDRAVRHPSQRRHEHPVPFDGGGHDRCLPCPPRRLSGSLSRGARRALRTHELPPAICPATCCPVSMTPFPLVTLSPLRPRGRAAERLGEVPGSRCAGTACGDGVPGGERAMVEGPGAARAAPE